MASVSKLPKHIKDKFMKESRDSIYDSFIFVMNDFGYTEDEMLETSFFSFFKMLHFLKKKYPPTKRGKKK